MAAPYRGSAFGLRVHSTLYFPELPSVGDGVLLLVEDEVRAPLSVGWSRLEGLRYGYQGAAELRLADRLIIARRPDVPESVGRLLVLGTGVAMWHTQAGSAVLHGTTVACGDGSFMICGPSGAGKSTLTAACLARGAVLIADDVGVLRDGCVLPGLARIKLWADTAQHFYGEHSFARVHPDFEKFAIPTPVQLEPTPLRRVVVLERGLAAGLTRLRGGEALGVLLANHRVPEALLPHQSAQWLQQMQALLQEVEVLRLTVSSGLHGLDAAAALLVEAG